MGEDIARCPSCSLIIRVIYDPVGFALSLPNAPVKDMFLQKDEAEKETSDVVYT